MASVTPSSASAAGSAQAPVPAGRMLTAVVAAMLAFGLIFGIGLMIGWALLVRSPLPWNALRQNTKKLLQCRGRPQKGPADSTAGASARPARPMSDRTIASRLR